MTSYFESILFLENLQRQSVVPVPALVAVRKLDDINFYLFMDWLGYNNPFILQDLHVHVLNIIYYLFISLFNYLDIRGQLSILCLIFSYLCL